MTLSSNLGDHQESRFRFPVSDLGDHKPIGSCRFADSVRIRPYEEKRVMQPLSLNILFKYHQILFFLEADHAALRLGYFLRIRCIPEAFGHWMSHAIPGAMDGSAPGGAGHLACFI